jgi:hypothetical protein
MRPPAGFISAFYDPLNNPNAPTIGTATGGDASASVAFTPPSNVGGSAISEYGAISTPGNVTASAASSPISVTGLTNGTAYTFAVWAINTYGPSAFSASSNSVTPAAAIGVFGGGFASGDELNVIDYVTISTTGNATDFGDLTAQKSGSGACASSTRGVWAGGANGSNETVATMLYVTIASTGNSTSFGNLSEARRQLSGCNSSTRGIFASGLNSDLSPSERNTIDFITIATTGNATDFGDLTIQTYETAGCSSPTRGIFAGGNPSSGVTNVIGYVTIASAGNATDFGDLTVARRAVCGFSSSTRGVFGGGRDSGGNDVNTIDYVTIASTGNATDFGDLYIGIRYMGSCSSETRGLFAGGLWAITAAQIDYVTIASTGNSTSFGNLTVARYSLAGCSSGNGGLS